MKSKNRCPLGLEALEDRWVPATVRFDGSNLFVSSPLIVAGASKISVTEKTANTFQVLDNGNNDGTYTVTGNITVTGNNAADTITVSLSAVGLAGNLNVTAGNGNDTVTVDGSVAGAFIAGNSYVSLGNGSDSVSVGSAVGLTARGNLNVSAHGTGGNVAFIGGSGTSSFLGPVSVTDFPIAILGTTGDTFLGGISVQDTTNPTPGFVFLGGADSGNLTVNGGVGGTTLIVNGNVLGNLSTNLGNGTNFLEVAGTATAISVGNLNVSAGNGTNTLLLGGGIGETVLGNTAVNLGNGVNSLDAATDFTVNNNLFVNDGNGGLTETQEGTVGGNLTVNAGNGNNAFTLTATPASGSVGGTVGYTGGNGGNSVTINNTGTSLVTLNVRMGNSPGTLAGGIGNNVFTIGAGTTPGTLTGFISWGIPTSAANGNLFMDNGYVWTNPITLINVPS